MFIKRHILELEKKNNQERRRYIKYFISRLGVPYCIHKFRGLRKGENIIVDYPFFQEIPLSAKKILLSAHYDRFLTSPGANDNASGVAVLLEFLRNLKEIKPQNTYIRIAFFDMEEGFPFLGGSKKYVKKFGFADIERHYNFEMLGIGEMLLLLMDHEEDLSASWIKPFIRAAENSGMRIIRESAEMGPSRLLTALGLSFRSDHVPFIKKGFSKSCTFVALPEKDIAFREIMEERKLFCFLLSLVRYLFTKKGDFPEILRHYHCANDNSAFVEENALNKIFNITWEAIFNEKGMRQ